MLNTPALATYSRRFCVGSTTLLPKTPFTQYIKWCSMGSILTNRWTPRPHTPHCHHTLFPTHHNFPLSHPTESPASGMAPRQSLWCYSKLQSTGLAHQLSIQVGPTYHLLVGDCVVFTKWALEVLWKYLCQKTESSTQLRSTLTARHSPLRYGGVRLMNSIICAFGFKWAVEGNRVFCHGVD